MPQSVGLVPTLRRGGGGGVVHVFSVCASVCWTCADITSGGGGVVHDTVLCEYPCLLDLC